MSQQARQLREPAFIACVILLAVAGVGGTAVEKFFGIYSTKIPIEMKKSLAMFDQSRLGPVYNVLKKDTEKNADTLKELGTNEYLQWLLEDTTADEKSPVRNCSLFITYYGQPDRVPHVPEECYFGGGYSPLGRGKSLQLNVPAERFGDFEANRQSRKMEVRYLEFSTQKSELWLRENKFSVLYIFRVNDLYANNRMTVQAILGGNLFGKHSYFSKVEWRFFNSRVGAVAEPSKEEIVKASEKLLSVVLPILEKDHWPVLSEEPSVKK